MSPRRNLGLTALVALLAFAASQCGKDPEQPGQPVQTEPCALVDGLSPTECATLPSYVLPLALPPARGNAKGDDQAAAELGFTLFFDARLSANQNVRCATCHPPERFFQDGLPVSKGIGLASRNAPTMVNAARLSWIFWDGRADSVWSQPLFAIEHPREMGFDRLALAHRMATSFSAAYVKAFGALPALDDATRFPANGKPGDPSWEGMAPADREAIEVIAANVGKAFEAYERRAIAGRAPLDSFLLGDASALTPQAVRGFKVFIQAGCPRCHAGPMLTDEKFHRTGLGTGDGALDRGRETGLATLAANEFRGEGDYADPPRGPAPPAATADDVGAFRTPSLRNVARTAPYGHDGSVATLRDMVQRQLGGGLAGPLGPVDPLLEPQTVSSDDVDAILAFLAALDGTAPPKPWGDWPDR
jgi:cytochrome c peroxidase